MKGRSPLLKYWLPAIAWMALIFIASTDLMSSERTSRFLAPFLRWLKPDISDRRIKQVQLVVRKGAHVSEYAVLSMLLLRALRSSRQDHLAEWQWSSAAWALLIAAAYAVTDEFHQYLTASRFASGWDVIIDTLGATLGLVLVWAWRGPRKGSLRCKGHCQ
ncbi:MAG: VanZ family protein [Verrucomicrobia bacterium]|nr:VanZ family protein [Verrucomicrobiota bacterium]